MYSFAPMNEKLFLAYSGIIIGHWQTYYFRTVSCPYRIFYQLEVIPERIDDFIIWGLSDRGTSSFFVGIGDRLQCDSVDRVS